MSEGGDVTMEEDYTLSYRTEEWEPESPNNLKFSKTHIQGATGIIAKDLGGASWSNRMDRRLERI